MQGKWYSVTCDCGFTAKSHNQGEMTDVVMLHGKRSHPDMKLGPNDAAKMIKAM